MTLIKLFVFALTAPSQIQQQWQSIDWQAYVPKEPVVMEGVATTDAAEPEPMAPDASLDAEVARVALLGTAEEMKGLMLKGGRPNAVNEQGEPALAVAAKRANAEGVEVMRALLKYGADKDGRDKNQQTPLFFAAKAGNLEGTKLLLSMGAQYYAVDAKGELARTHAFRAGHKELFAAMDAFVAQTRDRHEQFKLTAEAEAELKKKKFEAQFAPAVDAAEQTRVSRQLAAAACRYQYWYYVELSKQKTEIKPEAMQSLKDEYKATSTTLATALVRDLQMPSANVEQIQQAAAQSIYNELEGYKSNTNRRAQGVGTQKDVDERCPRILDKILAPLQQ